MAWKSLSARVKADRVDELEDFLWHKGAISVTVEDAGDMPLFEPAPEETPLWDEIRVTGLFEDSIDEQLLRAGLEQAGFQLLALENLEDRAWEREWLKRFKPMQFGKRLWICPSTHELPGNDKVIVHLDPGLAFGTGSHPTTSLCLAWLDSLDLEGKTLVDYGCGSGILAIAAALLGCKKVLGIDQDPQALIASRENCKKNLVEDKITFYSPNNSQNRAEQLDNKVDFLVANILAKPLMELKATLLSYLGKGSHIAMSGVMTDQKNWVLDAYRNDVEFETVKVQEDWLLLTGKRL